MIAETFFDKTWVQIVIAVVNIAIAAGLVEWLRQKARGAKVIRDLNAESIVDFAFDRIVSATETFGKDTNAKGPFKKTAAIERAKRKFPKMTEEEVTERAEAAVYRMKEAEALPKE